MKERENPPKRPNASSTTKNMACRSTRNFQISRFPKKNWSLGTYFSIPGIGKKLMKDAYQVLDNKRLVSEETRGGFSGQVRSDHVASGLLFGFVPSPVGSTPAVWSTLAACRNQCYVISTIAIYAEVQNFCTTYHLPFFISRRYRYLDGRVIDLVLLGNAGE